MGSRRVLGNDPFQRGAAERPPVPPAPEETPPVPRSPPEPTGKGPARTQATSSPRGSKRGESAAAVSGKSGGAAERRTSARKRSAAVETPRTPASPPSPSGDAGGARTVAPLAESARSAAVPLAASVVPEPPPVAPASARAEPATGSSGGPTAPVPAGPVSDAPAATSAPTLSWTPLPDAVAPVPEEPAPRPAAEAAGAGGTLAEVLREAPGLLAEAWSALEAALRALRAGLGTAGGEQLDVYGRDARLTEAVAPLVDFLYSRWFRVEVEGAAHVPAGGALLVANHAGALPLDGPILHEALRRERPDLPDSRWLAEDQVFYAPLLGTLFNRLGAVRASPDSATRLLAEGRPVLIFPEGIQGIGKPFRERYRLQRFGRGGFVKLALRTRRPILPVAIMGAEETLPLLGKLPGGFLGVPYLPVTPVPLPAKWRIRIGEAIDVPAGAKETDLSVVESVVDATRNTIEHMLRELLGARGGVFLG